MSIINDALKKVQNNLSTGKKTPPSSPTPGAATPAHSTPSAQVTASGGQQPLLDHELPPPPAPQAPVAPPKVSKTKESSLIYILGALCLLIALFAPIVDHKSVFGLLASQLSALRAGNKTPATSMPEPATQIQAPTSQAQPPEAPTTVAQKAAVITENITNSLVNFNNPAATATPTPQRTSSVRRILLSGILAQGDHNVALIDGQVYEAGEKVDGVTIVAINPNNIVVEENGRQRTVKVGQ